MIKIKDTKSTDELNSAMYNANLALQKKLKITNESLAEFDKDYGRHFYHEYGVYVSSRPKGGPQKYWFKDKSQLMWFILKWS